MYPGQSRWLNAGGGFCIKLTKTLANLIAMTLCVTGMGPNPINTKR